MSDEYANFQRGNSDSETVVPTENVKICEHCGAKIKENAQFCSKCGQKVGVELGKDVNDAIGQFNANVDKENEAKKKKPMKIIIGAVVAFFALILMIVIAPKIFVSVEKLCAQGNYEKAYEKAKGDEKKAVKVENLAAVLSAIQQALEARDFHVQQIDEEAISSLEIVCEGQFTRLYKVPSCLDAYIDRSSNEAIVGY